MMQFDRPVDGGAEFAPKTIRSETLCILMAGSRADQVPSILEMRDGFLYRFYGLFLEEDARRPAGNIQRHNNIFRASPVKRDDGRASCLRLG
jgi:hypothetical protein